MDDPEFEPPSLTTDNTTSHDFWGAEVRVTMRSAELAVMVAEATAVMVVDTPVALTDACAAQVYAWKALERISVVCVYH